MAGAAQVVVQTAIDFELPDHEVIDQLLKS